jgi:hypothetical protein
VYIYRIYIISITLDQTLSNNIVVSISIIDKYTLLKEYKGFTNVFSKKVASILSRNVYIKYTIDIKDR